MIEHAWGAADARSNPDEERAEVDGTPDVLSALLSGIRSNRSAPAAGAVDGRVLVVGTFGTEPVADQLASILERRGRDAHAVAIERGGRRPVSDGCPNRLAAEALIVEGGVASPAAIREVSALVGAPDVVVVTAIGRGDLEQAGTGRDDLVRAIAGAVPQGAHVVNAEGTPAVRRYLETAVRRRGATVEHVRSHDDDAPGGELAAAIDATLAELDEPPLPTEERAALVEASRPEWLDLPGGRVYDALGVTDTVAIDRLQHALPGDDPIALVAGLAREQRDFAAALVESLDGQSEAIEAVHAVGPLAKLFATRCPVPAVAHGVEPDPGRVLEAALSEGPALLVGSERIEVTTALSAAITERISRSGPARIG